MIPFMVLSPVADPGFPIWWGDAEPSGGADLRRRHFSAKTYGKMKELDPIGGCTSGTP